MSLYKIHLIDGHSVTVRLNHEMDEMSIAAHTLPCEPAAEVDSEEPGYVWGDMRGALVSDDDFSHASTAAAGFYLRVQLFAATDFDPRVCVGVSVGVFYRREIFSLRLCDAHPTEDGGNLSLLSHFPSHNERPEERSDMEELMRLVTAHVDTQAEAAGIHTGERYCEALDNDGAAVAAAADE